MKAKVPSLFTWLLIFFLVNGVLSFAYDISRTEETTTLWALLATNLVFYLGLTQTGIIFSTIMRIAKSEWSRYFSRLGEILTLSFIPVALVMFIILWLGGGEKLFYWVTPSPEEAEHLNLWLRSDFFIWRYVVSMSLFYGLSYWYFTLGRVEERGERVPYDIKKRLNLLAGFVMFAYVMANTNVAWDFGMMIIRHWESTIFPPYYWVGNVFGGTAFLYLMSLFFMPRTPGEKMDSSRLDSMGKLLLGFAMLWIYMFWSQHIVIWYGDLPNLTGPFFKQMNGNFRPVFAFMMLFVFIFPFLALIFRRVKLSEFGLSTVAIIIIMGVWANRYLMIIPVFSDGSEPAFATYTGVSLVFAGLALAVLPAVFFLRIFPRVTVVAVKKEE